MRAKWSLLAGVQGEEGGCFAIEKFRKKKVKLVHLGQEQKVLLRRGNGGNSLRNAGCRKDLVRKF